jgi:hypothetical protein
VSLYPKPVEEKFCFVYCGDDRCTCRCKPNLLYSTISAETQEALDALDRLEARSMANADKVWCK